MLYNTILCEHVVYDPSCSNRKRNIQYPLIDQCHCVCLVHLLVLVMLDRYTNGCRQQIESLLGM